MVDFNRDGQTEIAEMTATLGFLIHLDRRAQQRLNRKLAAMSDYDRAWFVANEKLRARCRGHFGMRRREWDAVARFMNHVVSKHHFTPELGYQWWLMEVEVYWFQGGGRRRWYK